MSRTVPGEVGAVQVNPPTGSASPAPAALLPARRVMVILIALLLGMMLAALDQTVVATALPTIVGKLGGAQHISWIITAYILAATVSTPLWGKLGDQYGRKTFFQASITIFLIGSALSGASTSMLWLILSRAFQGLGGGGLIVGAQAIIGAQSGLCSCGSCRSRQSRSC